MTELHWTPPLQLPSGGELRTSGSESAESIVLLASGGTATSRAGRWSSNWRYLAPKARRDHDAERVRIVEVRYLDSTWRNPRGAIADVAGALAHERARANPPSRIALVGFSMGGLVCTANAGGADVVGLIGIAPWLPAEVPVKTLRGKRLYVVHGSLDGRVPGIPGVAPSYSRRAVERAAAAGVDAEWVCVAGGHHGLAVRIGSSGLVALPRARTMARLVRSELSRMLSAEVAASAR